MTTEQPPVEVDPAVTTAEASRRSRRRRLLGLGIAVAATAAMLPLDGALFDLIRRLDDHLSGDLYRELKALQQYGQGSCMVIAAILIWRLDPKRWWRLADLALATGAVLAVAFALKLLTGRARPRHEDPWAFVGPFGTYEGEGGEILTTFSGNDLGSMPSTHTAAAVVLSVFLAMLYPRLRELAIALAALVGVCRIIWGAHYPTDVLVGALVALAIAPPIIRSYAGVGVLDWMGRLWNRDAAPALPGVIAHERRRRSPPTD